MLNVRLYKLKLTFLCIGLVLGSTMIIEAYPIDGFRYAAIRRLVKEYRDFKEERGSKLKPGALKMLSEVSLNMIDSIQLGDASLPSIDPAFQKEITKFFGTLEKDYSLSVMDITEGRPIRMAEHRPLAGYQPGSVGKLAVLLGFFTELDNIYSKDWTAKTEILKTKMVYCEKWGIPNSHTVPFYDIKKDKLDKRYVKAEDSFTLYEWLDHMLSVSSNAAASIIWREALYMRLMGPDYECANNVEIHNKMKELGRDSISNLANQIVNDPLRKLDISSDEWRLGSFFTAGADQYCRPIGGSIGTTRGLIKYLVALEKGQLVDTRTSLEMKCLLYITDRRIRYAASPSLNNAMVYFKSGSLYKCRKDGTPCGKYKGNVDNFMNSIAIVEREDCTSYLVALMSNVLNKNSANEHQALASKIDKLID